MNIRMLHERYYGNELKLLQGTDLDEERNEYVGLIVSYADSLLTIIDDILSSCQNLNQVNLRREKIAFDLTKVLTEIAVLYGEISAGKDLTFSLDCNR